MVVLDPAAQSAYPAQRIFIAGTISNTVSPRSDRFNPFLVVHVRAGRIGLPSTAWEAVILPLNYARKLSSSRFNALLLAENRTRNLPKFGHRMSELKTNSAR